MQICGKGDEHWKTEKYFLFSSFEKWYRFG